MDTTGVIHPSGILWEPYGDLPYLELITLFSDQAFALQANGATEISIEDMDSLSEARGAVLGARQTGMPIYVSQNVDENGITTHDADILASMIILQGLGIEAYGFHCTGGIEPLLELVDKLAPHAIVPLMVTLDTSITALSDTALEAFITDLLVHGINHIRCTADVPQAYKTQIKELEKAFDSANRSVYEPEEASIAACSSQTFFLREDMVQSRPLQCHYDMCDDIINAEDDGCEILVVEVSTVDDAYQFGLNCHLSRVPIALISDSDEALETALLLYNGRAIIDYLSDVPDDVKDTLARGYNALIL